MAGLQRLGGWAGALLLLVVAITSICGAGAGPQPSVAAGRGGGALLPQGRALAQVQLGALDGRPDPRPALGAARGGAAVGDPLIDEARPDDLEDEEDDDVVAGGDEDADADADDGGEEDPAAGDSEGNPADAAPKETFAHFLDEALREEFHEEEEKAADVGRTFNETLQARSAEAKPETVIIIRPKDRGAEAGAGAAAAAAAAAADASAAAAAAAAEQLGPLNPADLAAAATAANASAASGAAAAAAAAAAEAAGAAAADAEPDVDRIIDSQDNEYVLSRPNRGATMSLNLDQKLVRDLGLLIAACALAGLAAEAAGQPAINGYFVAGVALSPGGLSWIAEPVQVQSVAQLGVQLLLFGLGLEFSAARLRAVGRVALAGGLLEVAGVAAVAGLAARAAGAPAAQGALTGAILAMSSTSIVVRSLQESRAQHAQHAQITIGTLIAQDCAVGLLFALMPVLARASRAPGGLGLAEAGAVAARVAGQLAATAAAAAALARTVLPPAARRAARASPGSFQLAALALCFAAALATTRAGVSAELGAFFAGLALGTTEQRDPALHALEPVSNLFLALFISSTGLVLSPRFLLQHLPVLAAGVMVVVSVKTLVVAGAVVAFGYPPDTALAVGVNLAQVGEFAFVLLSTAHGHRLVGDQVYHLLMGTAALSLLATPALLQVSARLVPGGRAKPGGGAPGDGGLESPGSGPLYRTLSNSKDEALALYRDGPMGAAGGGGGAAASPNGKAGAAHLGLRRAAASTPVPAVRGAATLP